MEDDDACVFIISELMMINASMLTNNNDDDDDDDDDNDDDYETNPHKNSIIERNYNDETNSYGNSIIKGNYHSNSDNVTDYNFVRRRRRLTTLEIPILLVFFSMNLSNTIFQNQIINQVCTSIYNFNVTDCSKLGTSSEVTDALEYIETKVQPYAANIFMTNTLLLSLIPSVLSLFIGPWSDKFGRKPLILFPFIGNFISLMLSSLLTFLSAKQYVINPWFYTLTMIPVSICGGTCALITGTFCFITDLTTSANRAYRMVLIEGCIFLGLMCGSISSSYLLAATNSCIVFLISGCIMIIAILYTIIFVDESLPIDQREFGDKFQKLFEWTLVKETFKTCFKKRSNYDRAIIWIIMSVLGISVFVMEGNNTIFFLFVREKFEWTIKDYTIYDAISIVAQIFGSVVVGYILQEYFEFSIISLALIAFGSDFLNSVIKLTSIYPWHLYLSICFGFLKSMSGPMSRAILSNVAPVNDIGKLNSLATCIETISPLASAPIYTYVYNSTISIYPGAFNAITAFMFLICYILIAIIFGIQKSFPIIYSSIGS